MPDHNKSTDDQHQKLHLSKDSSQCLETKIRSSNSDHGMRVGFNYQAEIPQFIAYAPAPEYYEEEKAIRVWSPYNPIQEHILDEFILKAKGKFFYNMEQALGMLSWHKFDIARAYADLPNFVPYPNEWSVEDKVLFEQAYQFHEKQFNKIRQMLPDKSMPELISYYYSWKKTRTRASLMERQTRRLAGRRYDKDGYEITDKDNNQSNFQREENANGDMNEDEDDKANQSSTPSPPNEEAADDYPDDIICCMCETKLRVDGNLCGVIVDPVVDKFCTKCYINWKIKGKPMDARRELGDCYYEPVGLPRKILFAFNDVLRVTDGSPDQADKLLKQYDGLIENAKREIQIKKQKLSVIDDNIKPVLSQIEDLDVEEFLGGILPEYKPTKTWTPDETALLLQALRRYGLDSSAIADVIRTKSPEAINTFYVTHKDRLNLQLLVEDYEKTKAASQVESNEPKKQKSNSTTKSTKPDEQKGISSNQ